MRKRLRTLALAGNALILGPAAAGATRAAAARRRPKTTADEGALMAATFATQGYIVVAPNYAGWDKSALGYHPYLDGQQQGRDG